MQHRNTFTGGMKSGIDFSLFPQDSYTYLLNGCIISKDEHGFMVTNIKGHTAIHTFSNNEVPIGSVSFNGILYIITHYIGTNDYINFYSYQKTDGLAGWVDGMGMIPMKNGGSLSMPQATLGFTRDKLLDVFAKESYDGSVDIYICDGLHKNVIINTGLDRDGKFTLRTYSNLTIPSLFQMQKNVSLIPSVTSSVQSGGNMKPGTYYAYIRYEDDSLNPTPFIKEVGPFFIHAGHKSNNSASGLLNEDETRVNKSILLNISNIDTSYNKVSIGIVFYYGLNNVLSRENYLLNRTYQVVNGSVKVIINGDNEQQSLLVEEILKDNLRYNTSETHTQLENRYFGANWKSQDIDISILKELASKFIPHAFIKDYTGTGRTNDFEQVIDENESEFEYMEDEIYPLGVSFLIDGQYKTDVFPMFGWYEGYDYNNEIIGEKIALTYDKLIIPEHADWVVEHETITLVKNTFNIITYTGTISGINLYTTIPTFGITTGSHEGLFLHLNMSIQIASGTDLLTSISRFKTSIFACTLWLEDSTGVIYNAQLENLVIEDFDDVVYTEVDGILTLDLWKEYSYMGTVVSSGAETLLDDINISINGTYTDTVIALCNEMLDGFTHLLSIYNNKVYVNFSLNTTKDTSVVIKIYHANLIDFNIFTVFIPSGTIANYNVFAGIMDSLPTNNVDYILVNEFVDLHDGYEVNEEGLAEIGGGYWIDAEQYYYYENGGFPFVPITNVERFISSELVITPAVYITGLESINNNYGLFKFPKKEQLFNLDAIPTDIHFRKMGLKVADDLAKAFMIANPTMPTITEVYFVQGKRQENVVCQGVINPVVDGVGFAGTYDYTFLDNTHNEFIKQSTMIGNGNNVSCFPWMDTIKKDVPKRRFPLFKISREPLTHDNGNDLSDHNWVYQENAVTEMLVTSSVETVVFPNNTGLVSGTSALSQVNDLTETMPIDENFFAPKTKKFSIYSPDILMRNINIPDIAYIKQVAKLTGKYNNMDAPDISATTEHRYQTITCSSASEDDGARTHAAHVSATNYEDVDWYNKRLLNPLITGYEKTLIDNTKKSSTKVIDKDVINGWKGFSSRMKSIIEVYGDDMRPVQETLNNNTTQGYKPANIYQFFSLSRNENNEAGILINRVFQDTSSLKSGIPRVYTDDGLDPNFDSKYRSRRFGAYFLPYNDDDTAEEIAGRALPVVVSNMSMKSTPFIGVEFDNAIDYMYGTTDENGFCNSVVNVCRYADIDSYISAIEALYDIQSEQYNIIGNMTGTNSSWNNLFNAFKGDLFSQHTFMRTVRWSNLPESTSKDSFGLKDFDYAWKQGQALNVFLQSFCNTYLRVPSNDDTFYPYLIGSGVESTTDATENFVWKSTSNKFKNETWNSNAGYENLKGLISLPAFNDIFLNKKNKVGSRIYFSNKQVVGAFTDAYRQILLLQYQDFSVANGDIIKLSVFNSSLFSIQEKGINQHFGSQKLKSTIDSSDIIIGDRETLGEEYKQLADFGTQHKESVVVGDNGIYGVDWKRKRIWRIKPSSTTSGSVVFGVEDLLLQKGYHNFFNETTTSNGELSQNIMSDNIQKGIVSVFDAGKHEILITFKLGTDDGDQPIYKTLVFNEDLDMFTGYYSYNTNMYMTLDNRLFSFSKETYTDKLWEHNVGNYQKFYGKTTTEPLELEFIVNCANQEQNASQFEKDFLSHLIIACPEILDSIEWTTEYQNVKKGTDVNPSNPFINTLQFWTNPEYVEDKWVIPILKSTKSNNGPNGNTNFSTFEPESSMKGLWIKVKIKYTGVLNNDNSVTAKYFYLRNVVTNFLISYT